MKYKVLKLEITMGNAAMENHIDVANALRKFAARLADDPNAQYIFDDNGNCVGIARFIERYEK
jgi:hypothetical protein